MNDPAKCLQNARKIDPDARLCSDSLCASSGISDMMRRFCSCQPPYPPQDPCPYGPDTPVFVLQSDGESCYCCCGSTGTQVAVAAGEKRDVGDVWVGHMVRVASGISTA